jgi:hypothetical protein
VLLIHYLREVVGPPMIKNLNMLVWVSMVRFGVSLNKTESSAEKVSLMNHFSVLLSLPLKVQLE